jgi:hypothetical protein
MTPTELKMQHTIRLQSYRYYFLDCKCIVACIFNSIVVILDCKCIVGCIFNSIVFIITREIPV